MVGKDGFVKVGSDKVGYIDAWSISFAGDIAETNEMGERAKKFMNTTISASGSASGTLDTSDTAQLALLDMFTSGGELEEVDLHLLLEEGNSTDEEFTGQAVITGVEIGSSYTDKVTYSFNYQFSGGVTHNQAD